MARKNKSMAATAFDTPERSLAEHATNPVARNVIASDPYLSDFGDLDLTESMRALLSRTRAVNRGDLRCVEDMLTSQASTLDAIFVHLVGRAANFLQTNFELCERILRLGLKAQSQARAAAESLAVLKQQPILSATGLTAPQASAQDSEDARAENEKIAKRTIGPRREKQA